MPLIAQFILRYLFARRGFTGVVTWASVVGITLGVAALVVVMAVMAGFRAELLDRILGLTGHITISGPEITTTNLPTLKENIKQIQQVESIIPVIQGQVMLTTGQGRNGGTSGAVIRGVETQGNNVLPTGVEIVEGDITNLQNPNTIALGKGLAETLGVFVGDVVTIITPDGAQTPFGFIPRILKVRVGATFKTGLSRYDEALILSSLSFAQKLFQLGDKLSHIEIKVTDPEHINTLMPNLRAHLPITSGVLTWQQQNGAFFQALQIERVTMFVILSLIIVVAAFNIITGQIMLVQDKTADIAILRSMGATRSTILNIFLGNGLLLGLLGTGVGFLLGMLIIANLHSIVSFVEVVSGADIFSSDVYPLEELPARYVWPEFITVIIVSLVLTLLASLIPAWRAARQNPVEGLRNA